MSDKNKKAFEKWFLEYPSWIVTMSRQESCSKAWKAACQYKQKEIDELQAENAKLKKFIYALGHSDQVIDDVIESLEKMEYE